MAPSTRIPTDKTMPNITIILRVRSMVPMIKKPIRNDVGIAIPTKPADRTPKAITAMIMTNKIAVMIEPSNDPREE